jgi:hypothetical protein
MKSWVFTLFILLPVLICMDYNAENMQQLLQAYLKDPQSFLVSHNNRENFVAVFSNFTRLNGEFLYDQYVNREKDIQSLIDDLNKLKSKSLDNWQYDSAKGKFILPEESNFF